MLGRLNRITAYYTCILAALAWAIFIVCGILALRVGLSVQYPEQLFPSSFHWGRGSRHLDSLNTKVYWSAKSHINSELFLPKKIAEKAYASTLWTEKIGDKIWTEKIGDMIWTEKKDGNEMSPEAVKAEAHQRYASLREKVLQEETSRQWKDLFVPGISSLIMGVLLYRLARRCFRTSDSSLESLHPTFCAITATLLMGIIGLHTYSSVDFFSRSVAWPYLFPETNLSNEKWNADVESLLEAMKGDPRSVHGREAARNSWKDFANSLERMEVQSLKQGGTITLQNMTAEGIRSVLNAGENWVKTLPIDSLRLREVTYAQDLYTPSQLEFLNTKRAAQEKATGLELVMLLLVELMLFRGIMYAKAKKE